eukprot:8058-Heterococcus_DN1.PRE.2
MACTHAQGNVSGGVIGWFKDITGQTAKEQLVRMKAQSEEVSAQLVWAEQRYTKLTELYSEKMDEAQKHIAQESNEHNMCRLDVRTSIDVQADDSAAMVVGITADLAIANSIIEDFRDVTLDVLDAVTTIEHIAVEGVKEVEAICYLGLNATVAYAEMQITANVDGAAVARLVLIDSFNSTNSALQSQVPAYATEIQALGATLATLTKQIAGLTLVNECRHLGSMYTGSRVLLQYCLTRTAQAQLTLTHHTLLCMHVYWLITEALRILATLLAFCAAAYVYVWALLSKWWRQSAVVAVGPRVTVTEKTATGGDAPEDLEGASQSRRSTCCSYTIARYTTILQVTFGEGATGAERRATIPLYDNKAAGAGTITLGDASTASAASGTDTTMGTLLQDCTSIRTVTTAAAVDATAQRVYTAMDVMHDATLVRVFIGAVNVFKWFLSCFGLMCSVDTERCIAAAQRKEEEHACNVTAAIEAAEAAELAAEDALAAKNAVLLDTSADLITVGFALDAALLQEEEHACNVTAAIEAAEAAELAAEDTLAARNAVLLATSAELIAAGFVIDAALQQSEMLAANVADMEELDEAADAMWGVYFAAVQIEPAVG